MKKIYLLVIGFVMASAVKSNAQDTLIYESFNFQAFYDALVSDVVPPPANTNDPLWYSYDADGFADGSGSSTARPGGWFAITPFASVDTAGNVAIAANSWFTSPAAANNWLISPNVTLGAHDTLFWKSAPRQTPRYCDGYNVKISTTTNEDLAFTTTLFTAAEMTSILGTNDSVYAGYSFSTGFVHGQDGTYTEYKADSARLIGKLRPFTIPLDAYAGQNVFIAFVHTSFDDNLISIDDFMIRGTLANGIKENKTDLGLNVFPNPAADQAQVNYNLSSETSVVISIYDVTGKLISSEAKGNEAAGRHFSSINTAAMAKGFYTVSVQTSFGRSTSKLIVK
jgi:hypothetical protein